MKRKFLFIYLYYYYYFFLKMKNWKDKRREHEMGGDALICSSRFDICHLFHFSLSITHTLDTRSFSFYLSFSNAPISFINFSLLFLLHLPFLLLLFKSQDPDIVIVCVCINNREINIKKIIFFFVW